MQAVAVVAAQLELLREQVAQVAVALAVQIQPELPERQIQAAVAAVDRATQTLVLLAARAVPVSLF